MNRSDPHWQQLLDLEPDLDDPASHPDGLFAGAGAFPYDNGQGRRWGHSDGYQIELREGGWD